MNQNNKTLIAEKKVTQLSNNEICSQATFTHKYSTGKVVKWRSIHTFNDKVNEAKRRGLTCGVTDTGRNNLNSLKGVADKIIIDNACNYNGNKYTGFKIGVAKNYVSEAINRGLNCADWDDKTVIASKPKPSIANAELEKAKREAEELRKKLAALEKKQINVFGGDQVRPNIHIDDMCDLSLIHI